MLTDHDSYLNESWRKFFNWSIIFPFILFLAIMCAGLFIVVHLFMPSTYDALGNMSDNQALGLMFGTIAGSTLGIIVLGLLYLIWVIWFILASDNLFKLLNINRALGNILNIIGIFCSGLSFLIVPIFFWIQVKSYWNSLNIPSSWRAVVPRSYDKAF